MEAMTLSTRPKRSNAGAQMQGFIEHLTGMRVQKKTNQKTKERALLQSNPAHVSTKLKLNRSKNTLAHQVQRAKIKSADPISTRLTRIADAKQHRRSRQELATQNTRELQHRRDQLGTIYYGKPTTEMLNMYETDPQAALMFLADSTGFDAHHDQFNERTNDAFDGSPADMKHLSPLSDSVKIKCVNAYQARMAPDIVIAVCASCGRRDLGESHTRYDLQHTLSLHLCESAPRAIKYRSLPQKLRCHMNIYELENGQLINVHPELVQTEQGSSSEFVSVCATCSCDLIANKIPRFNVGNGYDFGRLPDLELTLAETMVTACCLRYQAIVKFVGKFPTPTQFGVTGHVLIFAHDGKNAMAKALPRVDIFADLNVAFIGAKQAWKTSTGSDESRKKFYRQNPSVTISAAKVFRWLYLKKALDPAFKDIDIVDNANTRRLLEDIPDQILANALVTDDHHVIAKEAMVNDNVAHIRTDHANNDGSNNNNDDDNNNANANNRNTELGSADSDVTGAADYAEAVMPYAFVFPEVTDNTLNGPQILRSLQTQLKEETRPENARNNEPISESTRNTAPPLTSVQVDLDPINDFSHNDELLLGLFSDLFFLGEGVPNGCGSLPRSNIDHLLNQADSRFAKNHMVLFTLFNQLQRHAAARQVHLKVRAQSGMIKEFETLVNAEGFLERLQYAIDNPDLPTSKALASLVTRLTAVSGANIPWSQAERESAFVRILALKRHFGPFSWFITFAPADMDSPLLLRLSHENSSFTKDFDLSTLPTLAKRHKYLASNPYAASVVYERLVYAFLTELIRMIPGHHSRTSHPPIDSRQEGVLGIPICYAGLSELQGRLSPHLHMLHNSDLSPVTLSKHLDTPGFMEMFMKRLDSMVQAWIPDDDIAAANLVSNMPTEESTPCFRDHRVGIFDKDIENDVSDINKMATNVALNTNRHGHSFTCHKGKMGAMGCRLCMPRGCFNQDSQCIQLEWSLDANGNKVPRALQEIRRANADQNNVAVPGEVHDSRVIVLELRRPGTTSVNAEAGASNDSSANAGIYRDECMQGPNGSTVTYSPCISAALRCNTAIEPLGNSVQEKAGMFYLIDYVTKDGGDKPQQILSLLKAAKLHVSSHPSLAANSGTDERTAQHVLTRILNSSYGAKEVGAPVAALALRNFPSNIFSHDFVFVFVRPAIAWVLNEKGPPIAFSDVAFSSVHSDNIPGNGGQETPALRTSFNPTMFFDDGDDYNDDGNSDTVVYDDGESRAITVDAITGNVTTIAQFTHYRFRGEPLSDFSMYEYFSCIKIVSRESVDKPSTSAGNRPLNATFPFVNQHPMHLKQHQRLRSKQMVPMIAGSSAPRHPGSDKSVPNWQKRADAFGAFALTLYCPWRVDGPPYTLNYNGYLTWVTHLQNSRLYIDKVRLFWLSNLATGLHVDAEALKLITKWRARYTTRWSNVESQIAHAQLNQALHGEGGDEGYEGMAANLLEQLKDIYVAIDPENDVISPSEAAALRCVKNLQHVISSSEIPATSVNVIESVTPKYSSIARINEQRQTSNITQLWSQMHQGTNDNVSDTIDAPSQHTEPTRTAAENDSRYPLPGHDMPNLGLPCTSNNVSEVVDPELNKDQNNALTATCKWVNSVESHVRDQVNRPHPGPLNLLILGEAGTGKSFFTKHLLQRLGSHRMKCVSFQGIAASLLPDGHTIHSTFAIPCMGRGEQTPQKSSKTAINRARVDFGTDVCVLVIDEISNTDADLLLSVDARLKEWFNPQLSFGGLGVILMGDFFQLPAVGSSLIKASLEPHNPAGMLFNQFQLIEFREQMRQDSSELEFKTLLQFFRNPNSSTFPIFDSNILNVVPTISRHDMRPGSKWLKATVLVAENSTRNAINKCQAIELAKRQKCPVIAWHNKYNDNSLKILEDAATFNNVSVEDIVDRMPDSTFYFVRGAPAVILDNISLPWGLTNGKTGHLHSITLDASKTDVKQEWRKIDACEAGEIYYLSHPPLSVNLKLDLDNAQIPFSLKKKNAKYVVLPFLVSKRARTIKPRSGLNQRTRKAMKKNPLKFHDHGVDLAFAMTYHKVQGRTLTRIILELSGLSKSKEAVASLYVALSRVRKLRHIRLLPFNYRGEHEKLVSMKFKKDLVTWWNTKHQDTSCDKLRSRPKHADATQYSLRLHKTKPDGNRGSKRK